MQQWGRKPEKQEYNGPNRVVASFKNRCLTDKPTQDEIFTFSGVHAFHAGRFREAMAMFVDAIELNPRNATAWLYVGIMHRELGDYDKSIRCISESITSDGTNAMAYVERADAHYKKRDIANAKKDSLKALELDPNYVDAYAILGSCRHDEGRHAEALVAIAKYCELNPHDAEARKNYGDYHRWFARVTKPKVLVLSIPVLERLPDGNWLAGFRQLRIGVKYIPRRDTNEA